MKSKTTPWYTSSAFIVLICCATAAKAQPEDQFILLSMEAMPSPTLCKRLPLPPSVQVGIPTWSQTYKNILLPDQSADRIVALRADGRATVNESFAKTKRRVPFAITQIGDEYLEMVDESDALWLDRNLLPVGKNKLNLRGDPTLERVHLGSIVNWTITTNGVFFGIGSISWKDAEEAKPEVAFVRKNLYRPGSGIPGPTEIVPLPDLWGDSISWDKAAEFGQFYNHLERFVASVGTKAYFLVLQPGQFPRLFLYDTERDKVARELRGLPYQDQVLPSASDIPLKHRDILVNKKKQRLRNLSKTEPALTLSDVTLSDLSPIEYQELILDNYSMPRGLVSQDGFLYLLYHSRAKGWELIQLFSKGDEVVEKGRMHIPSGSSSITLLPTPQTWFVFERSYKDGMWPVKTMLSIPQRWIQDSASSPFYDPSAGWIRCAPSSPL